MYKKLSLKILLTFFLILFSGASITHENIPHNIDKSVADKCVCLLYTSDAADE